MIGLAYLAALLAALACMALLDHRFRLVFWSDPRRAVVVLTIGLTVFLLWDIVAIESGYYVRGGSAGMTGIEIAAELPLEEPFFILFLCYLTLVAHGLLGLLRARRGRRGEREVAP